ncbi:MAG: hypothetical protein JST26_09660 [Bacteroidetes bacterium]|nr:hypothetical protein [Bacteroidota bacterium]
MILPNNGKVVVFDDQHKDVETLLKALSREKIPYLYYQDELGLDLPDTPVENIRLVILDLELVNNNPTPHNIIAAIGQRLKTVLTPKTTYILIYWSLKQDVYRKDLENAFENGLKNYKPVLMLSLDKAMANSKESIADYIRDSLREEMAHYNSLNAFLLWESCVNNAAGTITNNLTNIFQKNSDWDKNFCNLLFTLAKAQAGTEIVKALNDKERLTSAFEIINSTLTENIENGFLSKLGEITINNIKEGGHGVQPDEKIKINTSIHLLKSSSLTHYFSGNLYIKDTSEISTDIIKHNFKESKLADINAANPKLICLDITPSCDYSQRKNYTRILYGVKVAGTFNDDLQNKDSRYKLAPVMEFDSKSYILFDYRHFKTFPKAEFDALFTERPEYRLRNNLLLDIQAQLSNHINRPGIVTV